MPRQRRSILGWIGIVAGILAFAAALLPSRVMPLMVSGKPIEQTIVDKAKELRDRALVVIQGKQAPAPALKPTDYRPILATSAVMLGGAAFVLGILGFVRREDLRPAVGAALFGIAALAFEQLMTSLFMFVAIVLVMIFLDKRRTSEDSK